MDDICREMGISKKTLYEHFENKESLLTQAMELKQAEDVAIEERITATSENAVHDIFLRTNYYSEMLHSVAPAALYDMHKYYRNHWEQHTQKHKGQFIRSITANIELGQKEGHYLIDLDTEVVVRLLFYSINQLLDPNYFDTAVFSRERVHNTVFFQFMRGICTPQGIALWNQLAAQPQPALKP
jgi:TetR/AcrR family transcriptional regulator, cholesterol catabolism regulator